MVMLAMETPAIIAIILVIANASASSDQLPRAASLFPRGEMAFVRRTGILSKTKYP
jgi:hypothetical protein